MSAEQTKNVILNTAERLFANQGFAATSLRNIVSDASVNLAAVHYHFGSKEALITEVLRRRIEPMNAERLRLLDSLEAEGAITRERLEDIVEALVGPPLRLSAKDHKAGEYFMKIIGRTFAEADDQVKRIFYGMFDEVARRFLPAFNRACPQLSPDTLFWRCHFLIGSMAHTMSNRDGVEYFAKGVCDTGNVEGIIGELVAFAAAGMQASVKPDQVPVGSGVEK